MGASSRQHCTGISDTALRLLQYLGPGYLLFGGLLATTLIRAFVSESYEHTLHLWALE